MHELTRFRQMLILIGGSWFKTFHIYLNIDHLYIFNDVINVRKMRKAHLSCNKIDVYLNKAMKFCNNVAIADSVSLKDKTRN